MYKEVRGFILNDKGIKMDYHALGKEYIKLKEENAKLNQKNKRQTQIIIEQKQEKTQLEEKYQIIDVDRDRLSLLLQELEKENAQLKEQSKKSDHTIATLFIDKDNLKQELINKYKEIIQLKQDLDHWFDEADMNKKELDSQFEEKINLENENKVFLKIMKLQSAKIEQIQEENR